MAIEGKNKAAAYAKPGTLEMKVFETDIPEPGAGEVLLKLSHSGVCHSDFAVAKNAWEMLPFPTQPGQIGGHEGVGEVIKLGPGVEEPAIGSKVGIKWTAYVCFKCPQCLAKRESLCAKQRISGYYTPGTFQQYVVSQADYVTPIPEGLDPALAAPLLCGGVTVYTALKKANAKPANWVVISGAGGGLGHLGVQYAAKGMGFRVIGIDRASKESLIKECGAEVYLDFMKFNDEALAAEVMKITGGAGAKAVIVCNASQKSYDQAVDFLTFDGTLVCVGVPEGKAQPIAGATVSKMMGRCLNITASATGNRQDAIEALDFAARGLVKTKYRIDKMENLQSIFEEMDKGEIEGRVVIDLNA